MRKVLATPGLFEWSEVHSDEGAYMEQILRTHFEKKEVEKMDNIRTIAFQVPEEVFWELKAYLETHKLKQKDFMLSLIRRALDEDGQQPDEGNIPDA